MTRIPFNSDKTPPPAGNYSVAMEAGGLVLLAGQTQSNFAGFDIEVDAVLARR